MATGAQITRMGRAADQPGPSVTRFASLTWCRIADYLRLTSAVLHRDTRVQNFQFWIAPEF